MSLPSSPSSSSAPAQAPTTQDAPVPTPETPEAIVLRERIRTLREQVDFLELELIDITGVNTSVSHPNTTERLPLDDDDVVNIAATRYQNGGGDEEKNIELATSPNQKKNSISVKSTDLGVPSENNATHASPSKSTPTKRSPSPKGAPQFPLWGKRIIPNPKSQARDHLANIRTYLAWVRTALSAVGFGFTIYALGLEEIGFVFTVVGLLTLFYGFALYYLTQKAILQGEMRIPHRGILIGSTFLILLIFAGLVVTVVDMASSSNIISR